MIVYIVVSYILIGLSLSILFDVCIGLKGDDKDVQILLIVMLWPMILLIGGAGLGCEFLVNLISSWIKRKLKNKK